MNCLCFYFLSAHKRGGKLITPAKGGLFFELDIKIRDTNYSRNLRHVFQNLFCVVSVQYTQRIH